MKQFKQKFEEFVEDSNCSLMIDMLDWSIRFDIGKDKENDCTQIWWCFIDFGPVKLKLAPAHWNQW